ncbi:MAG: MATE family efflux transporter, partial [Blautia sp.]|nr:MATE family efflux transporter [Blautia sp.]
MTEGNPLRMILTFALPLLLGNLLQQLYNVADAAVVGRFLGADALGAVGATSSVQFLILGFCIGICTGFCVPIATKFGAHDEVAMRQLIFNGIVLAGIVAAVMTGACVLLCPQILRLLSTPDNIWNDTYMYILVIFIGIPFTILYNLSAGILRAVGDSRTPFLLLAFSTVTNIFLDIFCIAVLHWGCAGAAIATVASQGLSGLLCTLTIFRKYEFLRIRREERVVSRSLCGKLLMMGLPMGLQFSITAIGSMVMQSANNALGSTYVSAFTAAVRIKQFVMCPFDAIATGVATFCSQNYGAGSSRRIHEGYRIGIVMAVVYGLVSGTMLIIFGRRACLLFLEPSQTRILDAAALYMRISGVWFWMLGILNVNRITVQGLGFSGRAVFSGVMEMFARAGVVTLLVSRLGFTAICMADPAAWIAAVVYNLPMCLLVLRKVSLICGDMDIKMSHGD